MFEVLRRLTANYTEDEYKEWLMEPPVKSRAFRTMEEVEQYLEGAGIPKGKNVFTIPDISKCHGIKDIACLLTDVADDTGYEPEFLWEIFSDCMKESLEDGEDIEKAYRENFAYVATVSYEQDW